MRRHRYHICVHLCNSHPSSQLSRQEQEQVKKLKESDTRVRAHEMAHKAAAGSLAAGGPYYDLEKGPDGQSYAVGGEVPIRLPKTSDYKQALKDAQQAERAALAPADPSPDDYAAAAAFRQRAIEARSKIAETTQSPQEDASANKPKSADQGKSAKDENAAENVEHSSGTPPTSEISPPVPSSFVTSSEANLDSPT